MFWHRSSWLLLFLSVKHSLRFKTLTHCFHGNSLTGLWVGRGRGCPGGLGLVYGLIVWTADLCDDFSCGTDMVRSTLLVLSKSEELRIKEVCNVVGGNASVWIWRQEHESEIEIKICMRKWDDTDINWTWTFYQGTNRPDSIRLVPAIWGKKKKRNKDNAELQQTDPGTNVMGKFSTRGHIFLPNVGKGFLLFPSF